jgi:Ti-type conjugative transfer relaxase TraA
MLSIFSISAKDANGLSKYYETLATADDYYEEGQEPAGKWMGNGAKSLGLEGEIREGELLQGMQGYHPESGEQMAANAGEQHKPGWDATFSAPKSVSAIWATADESTRDQVQEAHQAAVQSSLDYLGREAVSTRHGQGGFEKQSINDSGGMIVAGYEHSTSRNQDPQLHTHCIILNTNEAGRGVDFDTRHKMSAGALYRTELASQLQELGFQVERDGDSFKVSGVENSLVKQWSSRREEIEDELDKTGNSGAKASAVAALNTREEKQAEKREDLFSRWAEEGEKHGTTAERAEELKELEEPEEKAEMKTGEQIMEDLTQNKSTVSKLQIRAAVAVESQGFLNAQEAEEFTEELVNSENVIELGAAKEQGDHVQAGARYTTQEVIDLEVDMLDRSERMDENKNHKVSEGSLEKSFDNNPSLSEEQREAVEYITQDSGAISVMQGRAGAGKSFTLGAVKEAFEEDGFEVIGTAVSNAASKNLESEAGIESKNTTLLQIEIENGKIELTENTVLVVDEAGMQSTRQTAQLLEMAEEAGAKVVLVGDSNQLQAIESGAPMRAIGEQVGQAELSTSRRQNSERGTEIANHFRDGEAGEALAMLDEDGHFHVSEDHEDVIEQIANAYLNDIEEGKSSIVVAASRKEVGQLNNAIRQQMKENGELEEEGINVATSTGRREFAENDQVIFGEKFYFGGRNNDDKSVWNGARGTITETGENSLKVKLEHSAETVEVDLEEFNKLDHGYATTVHKAQGATVDTAHVLAGEMTGKEWSYVAGSRHRESVDIYTTEENAEELEKDMSKSQAKDMATDYYEHSQESEVEEDHEENKELEITEDENAETESEDDVAEFFGF